MHCGVPLICHWDSVLIDSHETYHNWEGSCMQCFLCSWQTCTCAMCHIRNLFSSDLQSCSPLMEQRTNPGYYIWCPLFLASAKPYEYSSWHLAASEVFPYSSQGCLCFSLLQHCLSPRQDVSSNHYFLALYIVDQSCPSLWASTIFWLLAYCKKLQFRALSLWCAKSIREQSLFSSRVIGPTCVEFSF